MMPDQTVSYLDKDGFEHQVGKIVDYVESRREFVVSTNASASSSLTGSCSRISSLVDGRRLLYQTKFPLMPDSTLTLTLADGSTTSAIPICLCSGERLGVSYAEGSVIPLTYVSNYAIGEDVISGAWIVDASDGRSASIPYGSVDPTSTATEYTATVSGITSLYDGVTVMLHNGVVTSAAGFTVDVNGLGAKPCYNNLTNATQETTVFNVAYTMLFVYSTSLDAGRGGWWIYRGYDSNTNTIGYQLRTNSSTLPASDKFYRYRILFTSADGTKWVPANLSSSTNATSARTPNTRPIDPLGEIVYYGSTTVVEASASVGATVLWQQYTINLGYSFNDTGAALTLSYPAPVYVKCTPNADGSAVIVGYSQTLPTRADGYIYIFLGRAYSATSVEMTMRHPVYEWRDGAIREWDNTIATDILTNGEIDALLAVADA
jgi:hypothetical protein